ncbi:hypothetical protein THRCLA_00033 [Thraustotheca clavata]|uniref:Cwf15/Cwc15 cell cycle control protein n=1 Tax=Thraustotheca clavata TaxID=74557 RepID=A0A1W0AD79_9STRA|nr:hypothetical protein THRCLA_00033 [Thraustotheca clavata]
MTTAARPTFNAAMGKKNEGGWNSGGQISMQFSARDLPGHTKLKTRQFGQGTSEELIERDLPGELEERERKYEEEKAKEVDFAQQKILRLKDNKMLLLKGDEWEDRAIQVQSKYDDEDDDAGQSDSESDSDSDDSEDEEAELMRELEKIKREREEERLRKEQADLEEEEKRQREEILMGNPLTQAQAPSGSAAIKRKWNDDVVFKNQSRNEPELKKRFINDTIRNDFHRRFLKTYIQ